jgi:hypothetical protein
MTWLLIKHHDTHADPSWDIERPEFQRSALTCRTLTEIRDGSPAKKMPPW